MTLIEALEMIEAPLEEAILEADDFNDGALEWLVLARQALYKALELAREVP